MNKLNIENESDLLFDIFKVSYKEGVEIGKAVACHHYDR